MGIQKEDQTFPVYQALYNQVPNSIFRRNNITRRVNNLQEDENNLNIKIENKKRLKHILYNEIKDRYNTRIKNYKLQLPLINDPNKLEIAKFNIVSDSNGYSGSYIVFPKAFICKKCGDFKFFGYKDEKWEHFDIKHCQMKGCDGEYEQFGFVSYCEKCGNIANRFRKCKKHGYAHLRFLRRGITSPKTWRIQCTQCLKEGVNPKDAEWDFLSDCFHNDGYGDRKISLEVARKFKPINVQQGSVYSSVVITTVDIGKIGESEKYSDYIAMGLSMDRFNFFGKKKLTIKKISNYLEAAEIESLDVIDEELVKENMADEYTDNIIEGSLKLFQELKSIKDETGDISLRDAFDYLILKGELKNSNNHIQQFEDLESYQKNDSIKEKFESLKSNFGIEGITHIPELKLISSSIGNIKGINKFFEAGFVPHFEPHWSNPNRTEFKAYCYPYITEGIMIDLDKIKIVNWLIDNGFLKQKYPKTKSEAVNILLKLEKTNLQAYYEVEKLIHTFSHVLIRRSSLYTGLDSDSCSELLFPKNGAFLIYSTSNINIGGFLFVFEHSIFDWFNDVKLDINDCIFDPTCIEDEGACFSCLFLPEYVCCNFNEQLDRDVFLGSTNRYKKGFWGLTD